MRIDRLELDDIEPNPFKLADFIRNKFDLGFKPAPLLEIADAVGIVDVIELPLKSVLGVLITPPGKAVGGILLASGQDPNQKRFTLAHEIGHFTNRLHHPFSGTSFNCDGADISYKAVEVMEMEANRFASELLLPER